MLDNELLFYIVVWVAAIVFRLPITAKEKVMGMIIRMSIICFILFLILHTLKIFY